MKPTKSPQLLEREIDILKLRSKDRWKLKDIGNKYGITKQRVGQILRRQPDSFNTRIKHGSSKIRSNPSELYVFGKLVTLGYNFTPMSYGHPFDVVVEGKRVEIKYRSKTTTRKDGFTCYHFVNTKDSLSVDFCIFVCGDLNTEPLCYIFPGNLVKNTFDVPVVFKYKATRDKFNFYLENWEQLGSIYPIDISSKVK